jgi:hypothetical protein
VAKHNGIPNTRGYTVNNFEWLDPRTTDPIKAFLYDESRELDTDSDSIPEIDEDMLGLTILDKPHITADGSIVESRI